MINIQEFESDKNFDEIEDNRWLKTHNLTKREFDLVTFDEVGSGSFETTQYLTTLSTKKTDSLTTDLAKTTTINSSILTITSQTTELTSLTSEPITINNLTSTQSSQTTAVTLSVATSSFLATTSNLISSFETISKITSKTSRISTSISELTKTTILTRTIETTTISTENHLCTANQECLNVFGRSACVQNQCKCLPPSVLFNNLCTSNLFLKVAYSLAVKRKKVILLLELRFSQINTKRENGWLKARRTLYITCLIKFLSVL